MTREGDPMHCMFDTMVFNRILDWDIPIADLKDKATVYATRLQYEEIENTKNEARRVELLETFVKVKDQTVGLQSGVVGIMKAGEVVGSAGLFTPILVALNELNKKHRNNAKDALIAEAAIVNKLTLVTEEGHLREAASKYGAQCITLRDLLPQS